MTLILADTNFRRATSCKATSDSIEALGLCKGPLATAVFKAGVVMVAVVD